MSDDSIIRATKPEAEPTGDLIIAVDSETKKAYLQLWLKYETTLRQIVGVSEIFDARCIDAIKSVILQLEGKPLINEEQRLFRDWWDEFVSLVNLYKNTEPRNEAVTFLKRQDLFNAITKEEFDKKIVNELESRQTIFVNSCGKFVANHNTASYNLCVNSDSGAGKDWVVKNVLSIFPKDDVQTRTRISPTAFTYWHNQKFEPEWSWDGKICYLQDVSNTVLNCDVFKVMVSDGSCSTVVINQQAVDIIIVGKPVAIITTASAEPKSEMLRRFPMVSLDESVDQTKRIKKRQAEYAAKGLSSEYDPKITFALSCLRRVNVKVPFADDLCDAYPDDHVIMRTHFMRLLDLIKASAALHQYQRETDSEGFILATPQDYDIAIIALKATTSNKLMIPLTKKQKKLLAIIEEKFKNEHFKVSELSPNVPFLNERNLYDALDSLAENFLQMSFREEDKKKPVRIYKKKEMTKFDVPTWEEICKKRTALTEGTNETEATNGTNTNSRLQNDESDRIKGQLSHLSLEIDLRNFITSVKSGKLSGKSMPKSDFMEKINHDTDLFQKWLRDGVIGDSGAEVWIV